MAIDVISIGSSSSGNSYIIMAGGRTILLDVGLTAKRILGALEHFDIDPEEVDAVLITHEHTDHSKSVRAISRKCPHAVFYASKGTVEGAGNFIYVPEERLRIVKAGTSFVLRPAEREKEGAENAASSDSPDVIISTFPLSHDAAEPLGFTITSRGEKLAVVTDTGVVNDEIYAAISDADYLVFEANHDVDMLMFGDYPYPVKVRIKGEKGHLSNDYAGDVLASILSDRKVCRAKAPLRIMLAHLSFHNNAPLFARQTVEDALGAAGFHKEDDYTLEVAAKEGLTFML